jgi:hypothetical protein
MRVNDDSTYSFSLLLHYQMGGDKVYWVAVSILVLVEMPRRAGSGREREQGEGFFQALQKHDDAKSTSFPGIFAFLLTCSSHSFVFVV